MTNFKSGDKVRVVKVAGWGNFTLKEGDIHTVKDALNDGQNVTLVGDPDSINWMSERFELVKEEPHNKYKVGDVVIIKANAYLGDEFEPGSTATVLSVSDSISSPSDVLYRLAFPNYPNGLNFLESEIQGIKPEFTHTYKVGDKLQHKFDRDGLFYTIEGLLNGDEYYNVSWITTTGERTTQPWNIGNNEYVTQYQQPTSVDTAELDALLVQIKALKKAVEKIQGKR